MKKCLYWFVLVAVIFPALMLFPETKPGEIEAQLSKTEGKERINLLAQLTAVYRIQNPQKSIKKGEEALDILKTFPNEKVRVSILNDMSTAYRLLGNIQAANEHARNSLLIAKQINNKPGIADALNSLGEVCIQTGELDQARDYFVESLQLYKELNNQNNLALTYIKLCAIHWDKGDFETALDYSYQSLKIYEELGDQRGISRTNITIGVIFYELNQVDKSLEYYYKALKILEELKDRSSIAVTLNNIGLAYSRQEKYHEALKEYKRALKISEELGERSLKAAIFNNMGDVYRNLNNDMKALGYFNQSLEINEQLNAQVGLSRALINVASINQRLGLYKKANDQATRGLKIAKEIKAKKTIRDAYQILAEIYEAMADHENGLIYYKEYKKINDEILNESTNEKLAELETNIQITKRERKIELMGKEQEKQTIIRTFLILFALLILVLAFVIYTRYRLKARVSRALEKEIDERKRYEQKLRESEAKFRVLAEKSLVGIWIIQNQVIKYANPQSLKIFGYPLEEMIDKNPLELVVEEDKPIVSEILEKRMSGTGNTLSFEFKGITKEGETIHLESYGSSTFYQGHPAVLETVIDITRRKKTDSELIKSRKMESVGILAGGIAHDFNNLLAVIVGNTSMLKLSYGDENPKINHFLDNVDRASSQAADLAQKFITFSEGGWLMRKKVKLANILKDTNHLSPEINDIPCHISIPPDLDPIFGDERQLRQVLTNLVLNAHEASADDKKVIITAKNISLDKENQFSLTDGKYVQISVIDNGKGIPPDLLEKIFDPYFSTKTTVSQKGLGLGLALCYSIIKKHGGHIAITSQVQKGTTVDLYLPVYGR